MGGTDNIKSIKNERTISVPLTSCESVALKDDRLYGAANRVAGPEFATAIPRFSAAGFASSKLRNNHIS